jgi:hypothetical protein
MFILFCIQRFSLCLLYISIGQCLSYFVFYDFLFVYCTSRSAYVYLILYSTISSLFIVYLDRPIFILFCILRFPLCFFHISISPCLSYFVFYDFVFVDCISRSAHVYLILYSTISSWLIVYLNRPMFIFCILRFSLCLLYISIAQCLSYSVFYNFLFVYCTSQSVNVYLILYSTISSLFIVYLNRPMFILVCILRFSLCLLYISIGQCLFYSVFYDFVSVYCTSQSANVYLILYSTISSVYCISQSANVYLILYSTISSLFIVHLDRPMFILFYILPFHLCLLYISTGQCLFYSVFYDFVFVYCSSRSANVYLILYSTISSLFIVHLDGPMFI